MEYISLIGFLVSIFLKHVVTSIQSTKTLCNLQLICHELEYMQVQVTVVLSIDEQSRFVC